MRFKVSVVVRLTARVHYRGIEYSVPGHAVGQTVTLHLQQEQVSIYQGKRCLGVHPRFPENGKSSVLSEHSQEFFASPHKKPYAQRQILLDLDPSGGALSDGVGASPSPSLGRGCRSDLSAV